MYGSRHQESSRIQLNVGERITGCFALSAGGCDRILEELASCNYCLHPTYRVITVATAAGLERRAALCVRHFITSARAFPELKRLLSA